MKKTAPAVPWHWLNMKSSGLATGTREPSNGSLNMKCCLWAAQNTLESVLAIFVGPSRPADLRMKKAQLGDT